MQCSSWFHCHRTRECARNADSFLSNCYGMTTRSRRSVINRITYSFVCHIFCQISLFSQAHVQKRPDISGGLLNPCGMSRKSMEQLCEEASTAQTRALRWRAKSCDAASRRIVKWPPPVFAIVYAVDSYMYIYIYVKVCIRFIDSLRIVLLDSCIHSWAQPAGCCDWVRIRFINECIYTYMYYTCQSIH